MPAFTARLAGTDARPLVEVLDDTGTVVFTAGGARAGRAEAVILARWEGKPLRLYGVRGNLDAARKEVHRLATATTMRHGGSRGWGRGVVLDIVPAAEVYAVEVVR